MWFPITPKKNPLLLRLELSVIADRLIVTSFERRKKGKRFSAYKKDSMEKIRKVGKIERIEGRSKSVPMKSTFRRRDIYIYTDPVRRNCNDSVRELVIFPAKRSRMVLGAFWEGFRGSR